jgi:hypothetical protein
MMRFGLFLVFAVSMALPSLAKAGCSDCPFPMARFFGSWQADNNRDVTVIISQQNIANDLVTVRVVLWDNHERRAIGFGVSTSHKSDTSIAVDIRFENGKRVMYRVTVDPRGRGLLLDRGGNSYLEGSCTTDEGCIRLRPVTVRSYNNKEFAALPFGKRQV